MMKTKILIVEDNPGCLEILTFYLRHMGYEVIEAQNGREGLRKAQSENPDVIILDLGLPDIGAIEILTLLKQDTRTAAIPIVVNTAWSHNNIERKALNAGAAKFLCKPTSPTILRETIERLTTESHSVPSIRSDNQNANEHDLCTVKGHP
jgi:DNA-binding response OmpR family regulator